MKGRQNELMRSLETYLSEYGESHQNELNKKLHNFCVPAITWSLLAVLYMIPVGDLSIAHIFSVLALVYYASFKKPLMFLSMFFVMLFCFWSFQFFPYLLETASVVFVVAWIGQFYGHHVEGKKPSFFKDIFFLLIGPVWVLKKFFPQTVK